MDRWSGRVALVTGASAGIGEATTRSLVKHGMKVVGCARNLAKLQTMADELKGESGVFLPIQCDLCKREEIYAMFETIRKEHGGVDVCINNAGMSFFKPLLEGEPDQWQQMLDVNIIALCLCTKEAVKQMKERDVDGHIIMVSSMGGYRLLPGQSAIHFYAGTKHMVRGLVEGYRNELRQSRIRVSSISPGLVKTEFPYRMLPDHPEMAQQFYEKNASLKSDDVAGLIVSILQQPPNVQIHDILVRDTDQVN